MDRLRAAPIVHKPFAHVVVRPLFSACFYDALMRELPPRSAYTREAYAGTLPTYDVLAISPSARGVLSVPADCSSKQESSDCWRKASSAAPCCYRSLHLHNQSARAGLVLTQAHVEGPRFPLWTQCFRLVHSINFTRLLVDRFSFSHGIPEWKQRDVRRHYEAGTLKNTAALRIDPLEYHLTPHIDISAKLVTWQFFHPPDDELAERNVGTIFYEPGTARRGLELRADDRMDPNWLEYDHFTAVSEQRVVPNSFFAFAPNVHSWHGASITQSKMAEVQNKDARRTFLGFVTSSYHHFGASSGDWADQNFFI